MRVVGVTGLPGGVDGERVIQIAQIHDFALGWQPVSTSKNSPTVQPVAFTISLAAAGFEWAAVEQRLDRADTGFAQGFVLENDGMQLAPGRPFVGVAAMLFLHLFQGFLEGLGKDVVARFDIGFRILVVPPGAVRLG